MSKGEILKEVRPQKHEQRHAMGTGRELIVGFADVEAGVKFRSIDAPDDELEKLAEEFRNDPAVEAAFLKPSASIPIVGGAPATSGVPPAVTPSLQHRQIYLNAPPDGVNAAVAWATSGGKGSTITVIDLEVNWETRHEDLQVNLLGVLGGVVSGGTDHGTSVIGIIGGDENGFGVTGIAPEANVGLIAFDRNFKDTHLTIADATRVGGPLNAGDILLIECERRGPRNLMIPLEWWPDDFWAIRKAVDRGIIVVEAAANGPDDLGDPRYDIPDAGFGNWENPFRRHLMDSGAILVGAGNPPINSIDPDRSRQMDSNYGPVVDVQGWVAEVVTTGKGDVFPTSDPLRRYTAGFGGTSAAAAMIAGVVACVQGARRAGGKVLFNSFEMRAALRATGSPQQAAPGSPLSERIGNRPDLAQLLALP